MSKEINLLPIPRRRQLARRFFEHALRRFFWSLCLGLILISGVGLAALVGLHLTTAFFYPAAELGLEKAVIDYRAETRVIQEKNALIGEMQQQHMERLSWSTYLPELLRTLPVGVELDHVSGEGGERQLVVQGRAPARSALVALENKLRALSWVKSVTAPPANLLEKFSPEFTFQITL